VPFKKNMEIYIIDRSILELPREESVSLPPPQVLYTFLLKIQVLN